MSLVDTIRLWRGETTSDPRPNKALNAVSSGRLLRGFPGRDRIVDIIQNGVVVHFDDAGDAPHAIPRNHKSALQSAEPLLRAIRNGQDDGTYLVVDLGITSMTGWESLHLSPFGCVPKAGADPRREARVIHDLSHGRELSTNALTREEDIPPVRYLHVRALAERIELLRQQYPNHSAKMMKGDVKSAFRHIPLSADIAQWFAGSVEKENVAIIDLALPFGWTASPAFYGLFGGAISYLVSRESPQSMDPASPDNDRFFGYEWVDDHVLLEVDRGVRLSQCENALRLSMMAILGPRSINEPKFSQWSTSLHVLGLDWDTMARTVSMPEDKIAKATLRIDSVLKSQSATRSQLSKLLGSLRHVCSCVRPAKPFYQRIVSAWRRTPRFGSAALDGGALADLRWFRHILHAAKLRSIPTSFFCDLPTADVHLYMDASNTGLCVLHPARREYIRLAFDAAEQAEIARCGTAASPEEGGFTINVREHLSVVLGILIWGSTWTRVDARAHIKCWIDNQSAVTWCNSLYSRNRYSQELNRVIGAVEAQFGIHVSASHLSGASNYLADLGSRAWDGEKLAQWTNIVCSWQERQVPSAYRKIYDGKSSPFSDDPSPTRHFASTSQLGDSGAAFATISGSVSGCHSTIMRHSRCNWLCSPFTAPEARRPQDQRSPPFGPSSAISAGIIVQNMVSAPVSQTVTNSPSMDYDERVIPVEDAIPSPPLCSPVSSPSPTSASLTNACCLGLRCWAFSSCCDGPSTCLSTENGTSTVSE